MAINTREDSKCHWLNKSIETTGYTTWSKEAYLKRTTSDQIHQKIS